MVLLIPDSRNQPVVHSTFVDYLGSNRAGMFMRGQFAEDCPLCRAGVCQQLCAVELDTDEMVIVHGMAGEA